MRFHRCSSPHRPPVLETHNTNILLHTCLPLVLYFKRRGDLSSPSSFSSISPSSKSTFFDFFFLVGSIRSRLSSSSTSVCSPSIFSSWFGPMRREIQRSNDSVVKTKRRRWESNGGTISIDVKWSDRGWHRLQVMRRGQRKKTDWGLAVTHL